MREEIINNDESPEELAWDATKPPLTEEELEKLLRGF